MINYVTYIIGLFSISFLMLTFNLELTQIICGNIAYAALFGFWRE